MTWVGNLSRLEGSTYGYNCTRVGGSGPERQRSKVFTVDDIDASIIELLRRDLPSLVAIYRFGSSITAYERPGSDVDLAILPSCPLDTVRVWELAQVVAQALDKDVDLVDLLRASTVMRAQIISTGKRLYCSNRSECESFEDYAYSAYARLNEERKGILQDIKQRGTVYGG